MVNARPRKSARQSYKRVIRSASCPVVRKKGGSVKISLKATSKKIPHTDRFGVPGIKVAHFVEATLSGVTFTHECNNAEEARALVEKLSHDLI